jgi:ribosomal protein S18 acetylase RimI-like enzyme
MAITLESATPALLDAVVEAVTSWQQDGAPVQVRLGRHEPWTPFRRPRCLVGYDDDGNAVAASTVWSAGRGRPGLIERLGVHRDHRGRGHGRAIAMAAAAALQQLGSSSATVCTPSSNVGGVAAYVSAGFEKLPEVTDFRRPT